MQRLRCIALVHIALFLSGCALFQGNHTPEPQVLPPPPDYSWFTQAVGQERNTVIPQFSVEHAYRIKNDYGKYFHAEPSRTLAGAYRVTDLQTNLSHIATPSDTQPGKFLVVYEADNVRLTADSPLYVRPALALEKTIRDVQNQPPVFVAPQAVQEDVPQEEEIPQKDISLRRKQAEVSPARNNGAVFEFTFREGIIYKIATAERRITTVFLEPGEIISGVPIIGDPENWLADSAAIRTNGEVQHIIVLSPKYGGAEFATNMFIPTDRRYYLLSLIANRHKFLPAVRWTYPERFIEKMREQLALQRSEKDITPTQELTTPIDMAHIYTGYSLKVKGNPGWVPITVFDDGTKTYIEFPANLEQREMPVFALREGGQSLLTNYYTGYGRNNRTRFIVHRLFEEAELRLITSKKNVVIITRDEKL